MDDKEKVSDEDDAAADVTTADDTAPGGTVGSTEGPGEPAPGGTVGSTEGPGEPH